MTKILFAGSRQIDLSSPLCMGVLNVTPDSFSDGASLGRDSAPNLRHEAFVVDLDKVLYRAEEMVAEGASFLDVGGESTRPGATPVPVSEEIERVVPVVAALKARFDICLSVDTSSAEVMKAAIGAGAELVNDVRALADDRALSAIVDNRVAVCLMHMQGQPGTMQNSPAYDDVTVEVSDYLRQRVDECVKAGIDQAIARGLAYAPYADMLWCETATPCLEEAKKFADAIHAKYPDQLLAYNCSPSFNWKKNLDDATIAKFQAELSAMGYKYQFITLAGIHNMWHNMFELAHNYARGEGMKHYVEMVQEPEFAAAERGYTFVAHQQEVGTGYFDDVTTVIQGGQSSVTALTGSTEEEQF